MNIDTKNPDDALMLAWNMASPGFVGKALAAGADPNIVLEDDVTLLHNALCLRADMHENILKGDHTTIIPGALIPGDDGISTLLVKKLDHRDEREKASVIAHQLIAFGAQLNFVAGAGITPACDITVWNDPVFCASIWVTGIYTALKRGERLPRFDAEDIRYNVALMANEAREPLRPALRDAFARLANAKAAVADHLLHPRTKVEEFVADKLPPSERQYWQPTIGGWARQLQNNP